MEKFNKDMIFEDYNAYYYRLVQIGKAMFDLYDCKQLSREQIELLAMSSSNDILRGMEIVVNNRIALNKNYNLYKKNIDSIESVRRIRRNW